MLFINAEVSHGTFGSGTITAQENGITTVRFFEEIGENEIAKHDGLDIYDKAFCNDRIFKGVTERLNPALMRCYGFVLQWRRARHRNEYQLLYDCPV